MNRFQNGAFGASLNIVDTLPERSMLSGSRIITGAQAAKLKGARSIQITLSAAVSSKN